MGRGKDAEMAKDEAWERLCDERAGDACFVVCAQSAASLSGLSGEYARNVMPGIVVQPEL